MALVADDQAPKVTQPGEESLDVPAALVLAQRTTALRLGVCPLAPVGRNHLRAQLRERFVERIGVVAAISDRRSGSSTTKRESSVGRPGFTS